MNTAINQRFGNILNIQKVYPGRGAVLFFEHFHNRFPEIAEKEVRTLTYRVSGRVPPDTYALLELYCNTPGCDCRRVFLEVVSKRRKKTLATIAYGWEDRRFYEKWLGDEDSEIIDDMMGPALNLTSPQSKIAPALLEVVSEHIESDPDYVERLKRHYRMFKVALIPDPDHPPGERDTSSIRSTRKKVGRNDPCPCGSGIKYKKCCPGK